MTYSISNNCKVDPYKSSSLPDLIRNGFGTAVNKFQLRVFREYFGEKALSAKTVVIETNYISESYLDDYASYYAYSHREYDKKCRRIHFFSCEFTQNEFQNFISGKKSTKKLERAILSSYLGYVVVKPIPHALIGQTVLLPYPNSENLKRCFNSVREYKINLFGKEFSITSLAFQEQDKNVSACATCAIWFALQFLSYKFHLPMPSPYRITKAAGNQYLGTGRMFPSEFLDPIQIGRAITSFNLVYELRNKIEFKNDYNTVKAFLYAYNKFGLPILLGLRILGIGDHLITLVGHKEPKIQVKAEKKIGLNFLSDSIEKYYAHDEHTGPFSRIEFLERSKVVTSQSFQKYLKRKKGVINNKENEVLSKARFFVKINFSENEATAELQEEYCIVEDVIIPIIPQIRIKFEDIIKEIQIINSLFEEILIDEIVWDIYLEESNNFKVFISGVKEIGKNQKEKILYRSLPKYIWLATGLINGETAVYLIFDATDINSQFFCDVVMINPSTKLSDSLSKILMEDYSLLEEKNWKAFKYMELFDNAINQL